MDEDRNMTEVVDNADGNSVLSDISTMEDEDAEDVSLVEYARYYGLCQDYTLTNPLDPSGLPSPSPSVHPSSDDLQLPELSSDFMGEEKCTLDIASAKFLRSIALSQMEEEFDDLYDHHSKEDAKIEGPLLRTDAELDLKRFCRIRKAEDNLNVISFGSFDADQTEEPKLEWLDSELPAKKDLEAHTEKLQLNKAAVDFLKDVCVHTEMGLDDALLLSGELVNRRVRSTDTDQKVTRHTNKPTEARVGTCDASSLTYLTSIHASRSSVPGKQARNSYQPSGPDCY